MEDAQGQVAEQAQDWREGFLFVGNQLVLDLLNTSLIQGDEPVELLPDTDALARWLMVAGVVLHQRADELHRVVAGPVGEELLEALLGFRERLRAAVIAFERDRQVPDSFLTELNQLSAAYPERILVVQNAPPPRRERALDLSTPDGLWAPIVAATVGLFCDVAPERVRQCESCVVHFHDTSKKGSRRWCSMGLCGNRIKVAAYKLRQRGRSSRSMV